MKKYKAIDKMLKEDKQFSLEIYFTSMSYGIKNYRNVTINELDPYEGQIANPETSLDQQVLHGPRREKPDFNFKARDTLQALNLLERTCKGETRLKDNVQQGRKSYNKNKEDIPWIHGYKNPKKGLDSWIYEGFRLEINKNEKGKLSLKMKSKDFHTRNLIIISKEIENVDKAITLYEKNFVESSIIKSLKQGIRLESAVSRNLNWNLSNKKFEKARIHTNKEIRKKYEEALRYLKPFKIPKRIQKDLFTAILLEQFYSEK